VLVVASAFVYNQIKDKPFMMQKYVDLFINPPRSSQQIAAEKFIGNRNAASQFFGSGVLEYRIKLFGNLNNKEESATEEGKSAEKDFIDLLGTYGYVLSCWIFLFPIVCMIILFFNLIREPGNYLVFSLFLAISIFIVHSIVAGHGIKNPTPGTILAIMYVYVLNRKQLRNLPQ
jgi:hypothetical protein